MTELGVCGRVVSAIAGDAASNDEALVRSTTRADVVDARRLDLASMDRGLLVGLSRADEVGKEVRPVREKLALEPLVQEPEQQLPGMKPVAFCPIAEVARPVVA